MKVVVCAVLVLFAAAEVSATEWQQANTLVPSDSILHDSAEAGDSWAFSRRKSIGDSSLFWVMNNGLPVQVAAQGVVGALGPGRVGEDASDVFADNPGTGKDDYKVDVSDNGELIFSAIAGGSRGVWRFDGVSNKEIAREGTDGQLGPALGPGVMFGGRTSSTSPFLLGLHSAFDTIAAIAVVKGPGVTEENVSVMRFGSGDEWLPCTKSNTTLTALGPNVLGRTFRAADQHPRLAVASDGAIYARLETGPIDPSGIWSVCAGPPLPLAYAGVTGALGPGLGAASEFIRIEPEFLMPGGAGRLYFMASARDDNDIDHVGIFSHSEDGNMPVALSRATGVGGTTIEDVEFAHLTSPDPDTSTFTYGAAFGDWLVFIAKLEGGTAGSGLFRFHPESGLEVLALEGQSTPGGKKWLGFDRVAAGPMGQAIFVARTGDPELPASGQPYELWMFRGISRAAIPLLTTSDVVQISGQSIEMRTVKTQAEQADWQFDGFRTDQFWVDRDGWATVWFSDGSVQRPVRAQVFNPDELFIDGFE